jgi:hypothetical protein
MSAQEKKKRAYKVTQPVPVAVPVAVPEPIPVPVAVPEATKKKRVAKVAPVVESVVPLANVIVEEPKKKRSYKVRSEVVPVPTPVPAPVPAPAPVPVLTPTLPVEEPIKKRSYKVRTDIVVPPIPVESKSVVSNPPKKERKKRVVKSIPSVPIEQHPIKPKAIESSEAPLCMNDEDILIINVRKFEHNGKWYFLNSAKDKLYTVGTDGQPFQYHGRYNRESETIDTDFADSDAEY